MNRGRNPAFAEHSARQGGTAPLRLGWPNVSHEVFYQGWAGVARVLIVGLLAYVYLIGLLRLTGKRTLAKLNAFDLVVTVALGSTLSSVLLDGAISWTEGMVALATLVVLQLLVALVTTRVPGARDVVTARPTLLLHDGELDEATARRARVTPAEVRQAVRSSGQGDLGGVAAVVLETDGTLSVVPRASAGDLGALVDCPGWDRGTA